MYKVEGFREEDGWTKHLWERTIMIRPRGTKPAAEGGGPKDPIPRLCKRPYLIHRDGHVITIQKKAWADTPGIIMWIDLILSKLPGRNIMIWDNCGCHCVLVVQKHMRDNGIANSLLPVKMTDKLQVMDLVSNSPLKFGIRSRRCLKLFEFMQRWKIKRMTEMLKPPAQREIVPFAPPKPTLADGLLFASCYVYLMFSIRLYKNLSIKKVWRAVL
eukprot:COSAG05_NODE_3860_length_1802_cov_1.166177_2_plen_215_part_00